MNDLPPRIRAAACVAVLALGLAGCAPASSAAGSAGTVPRPTAAPTVAQSGAVPTLTLSSAVAAGPEPTRIAFASGGTDYYTEGKLAPNEVRSYVLRAKEAQRMDIDVDSPFQNVRLTISGASDGSPLVQSSSGVTRWNGDLPATQDYIVKLVGPPESTTYALIVSIPARVQFPIGATNATIRGKTQSVTTYLVSARAGENLAVRVTSPSTGVVLSIHGISDGAPFITMMTDATSWSGSVPATQDYALSLVATAGPSDYELSVSVQ